MTEYLRFKDLHRQAKPLFIGNVWNAQSAKVFEKLNLQAIGTSSAAIAHSLGYADGEQMPFSELLYIVDRIIKSTTLPLTVDIESGYGKSPTEVAENIVRLSRLGVVGINIEDSFIENAERKLKNAEAFASQLEEIITFLTEQKTAIFINVRCDTFLLSLPNALEEAKDRVKRYEIAGANGIFLPGITNESHIKEITSLTVLPLNVMCMPQLPDFGMLSGIGVKRISMGNCLHECTYTSLEQVTQKILDHQSFTALF